MHAMNSLKRNNEKEPFAHRKRVALRVQLFLRPRAKFVPFRSGEFLKSDIIRLRVAGRIRKFTSSVQGLKTKEN